MIQLQMIPQRFYFIVNFFLSLYLIFNQDENGSIEEFVDNIGKKRSSSADLEKKKKRNQSAKNARIKKNKLIEDQIIELQKTEEINKELKKKKLLLDDALKFCVNYMTSHIQIINPNSLLETFKRHTLTETAEAFRKLLKEKFKSQPKNHSYIPLSQAIKQPFEERLIEPVINRYPTIFQPARIDQCEQYLDEDCEMNRYSEMFIESGEIEVINSVPTEIEDFKEFKNSNTLGDDLDSIDVQDLVQFHQHNLSKVMNF
jgi:hypothetical protein